MDNGKICQEVQQKYGKENIMPIMGQMSLTGGQMQAPITAEERQLKNERKRVLAYIRQYERAPNNFNNTMIAQIDRMAMQYQIPFQRQEKTAGFGANALAFGGGLVDSIAFDLMPDKWYSDESTRVAKNTGKIGGAAAQIIAALVATGMTGGAAAPTLGKAAASMGTAIKGAQGLGKISAAAKGLGGVGKAALGSTARGVAKLPLGRMTTGAINAGKQALTPYGANAGWQWAKNAQTAAGRSAQAQTLVKSRQAIANTGNLEEVVSGANLTSKQVQSLTNMINRTYGKNSKIAKEYISQLNTANMSGPVNLSGLKPEQIIKMANGLDARKLVNKVNIKSALVKAGVKKPTKAQVDVIEEYLKSKNVTKLDNEAVKQIIKLAQRKGSTELPQVASLADIDKWQAATSAGLGFGALSMLNKREPSRQELEDEALDPFNV
jgi:hypothetical protein